MTLVDAASATVLTSLTAVFAAPLIAVFTVFASIDVSINRDMNREQQAKWWLAHEKSCRCEICGAGIWLKQLLQLQAVPDYLLLYHKDGDKGNYNLDNISLRCTWCAKYSGIVKGAFKKKKKRVSRKHGHSGSVWYNNGLMSKFIKPREVMIFEMMGWKKGRAV
mgnify:CR=1 FL=1